jgi:lipid-binding SYLF domain-containing protein
MKGRRSEMAKSSMLVAFLMLFMLFASAAWTKNDNPNAKSQELSTATQTLQQITSSNKVPRPLLDQAQCVAVVPKLTKAGFVAGGEHGTGVVSCRTSQGWSAPAFFSLSAGSIGLQAGAEQAQILLLMNDQGKQELLNGHFQLSANLVAEGPTGSNYNGSAWKAPVLSYEISHGAYGGVNLQGSKMEIDNGAMHDVYGSNSSTQNVLNGSVQTPEQAQQFTSALPHGR